MRYRKPEQVEQIIELREKGFTYKEIADELGLGDQANASQRVVRWLGLKSGEYQALQIRAKMARDLKTKNLNSCRYCGNIVPEKNSSYCSQTCRKQDRRGYTITARWTGTERKEKEMEVLKRYEAGERVPDIAQGYGVSRDLIYRMIRTAKNRVFMEM